MSKASVKRNAQAMRNTILTKLRLKQITSAQAAKMLGAINRAEQRGEELPDEQARDSNV